MIQKRNFTSVVIGLVCQFLFGGYSWANQNESTLPVAQDNVISIKIVNQLDQLQDQLKGLRQHKSTVAPSVLQSFLVAWGALYGSLQPILEVAFTDETIQGILPVFINPMMASVNAVVPLVDATMGTTPVNIDAHELQRFLQENPDAQIIDVRTPAEFEQFHIQGAINIPIQELNAELDTDPRLQKDRPAVTVCVSGVNGYVAALLAVLHGYTEVYNLELGIIGGWVGSGLPVVSSLEEMGMQVSGR